MRCWTARGKPRGEYWRAPNPRNNRNRPALVVGEMDAQALDDREVVEGVRWTRRP